jgi:hypothetical protein
MSAGPGPADARRRRRTYLPLLLAAGFTAALFFGGWAFLVLYSLRGNAIHERRFDPIAWSDPGWRDTATEATNHHTVRPKLPNERIANHMRAGWKAAAVEALIGPPDPEPYCEPGDWEHWLGSERSAMAVDGEWLVLDFDEAGRLERFRLAPD